MHQHAGEVLAQVLRSTEALVDLPQAVDDEGGHQVNGQARERVPEGNRRVLEAAVEQVVAQPSRAAQQGDRQGCGQVDPPRHQHNRQQVEDRQDDLGAGVVVDRRDQTGEDQRRRHHQRLGAQHSLDHVAPPRKPRPLPTRAVSSTAPAMPSASRPNPASRASRSPCSTEAIRQAQPPQPAATQAPVLEELRHRRPVPAGQRAFFNRHQVPGLARQPLQQVLVEGFDEPHVHYGTLYLFLRQSLSGLLGRMQHGAHRQQGAGRRPRARPATCPRGWGSGVGRVSRPPSPSEAASSSTGATPRG